MKLNLPNSSQLGVIFVFAPLQPLGYKNNLLKERGMAKDCNMGESPPPPPPASRCRLPAAPSFTLPLIFVFSPGLDAKLWK